MAYLKKKTLSAHMRQKVVAAAQNNTYTYLYAENFLSAPSVSPAMVFSIIKSNILANIKNKNDQKILNQLAKRYSQGKKILESNDDIKKTIINKVNELLSTDIDKKFEVNFNKLALEKKSGALSSNETISRIKALKGNSQKNGNLGNIKQSTLESRFVELISQMTKLSRTMSIGIEEREKLEDIKQNVMKIFSIYNQLFKEAKNKPEGVLNEKNGGKTIFEKLLNTYGIKLPEYIKLSNEMMIGNGKMDIKTAQTFRTLTNSIIAGYTADLKSNILGEIFEQYGYAAFALGDNIAAEKVEETIKNGVGASGRVVSKGSFDQFGSKAILDEILGLVRSQSIAIGGDKILAEIKYASQQKADLQITIANKELGISMKNIGKTSFKGRTNNITLSSGSPLSTHLLGSSILHDKAFKYFLNILVEHEDDHNTEFSNLKELGLDALALTILWQASTGRGVGKTTGFADILMWNNNKTGEVSFFDINTILEAIANRRDKINMISPHLKQLGLKNTYVPDNGSKKSVSSAIKQRIAKNIAETHAIKIKASIPIDVLNSVAHKTI